MIGLTCSTAASTQIELGKGTLKKKDEEVNILIVLWASLNLLGCQEGVFYSKRSLETLHEALG